MAAACALASGSAAAQAQPDGGGVATSATAPPAPLYLRLTLSTFLFRERGDATSPIVDAGAPVDSASPVRRYFGDLRAELSADGLSLDGRVRQTTTARYQSGSTGGDEYELRKLSYQIGGDTTSLVFGRQVIDVVGGTRVDGVSLRRALTPALSTTLFGGAFPRLGSRSVDTDYARIREVDGSPGARLIPVSGGLGASYATERYHGDVGLAAVYVAQDVPGARDVDASRTYATASGYARPVRAIDVYHYALVDLAGANGLSLTNGSLGLNVHPTSDLQLSAAANHVSSDILQIAARDTLADPDPTAIGVVQNNVAVVRVSQDVARGSASLALARQRFEISLGGALHRRPAVTVPLADGGAVDFPATRFADATLSFMDRRSIARLRLAATATLVTPLGDTRPNRARGAILRVSAQRLLAGERGEIVADVMAQRFRDDGAGGACTEIVDVLACYGATRSSAAQGGLLGSWRVAREWLFLLDAHVGTQRVESTSLMGERVSAPVYSLTTFARVQWRYR